MCDTNDDRPMVVSDIMSAPVPACTPSSTAGEAYRLMVEHNLGSLPVLAQDDGRLAGVVTIGNIMEARFAGMLTPTIYELFYYLSSLTVDAVMTYDPPRVAPGASLLEAATSMTNEGIKELPVVDDNGHLIGMITRLDLLQVLVERAGQV